MTRFKHDLILRIIKILDAVLVTVPFALCWYLYYAKHIASPFYAKGDYLVVALFFVLFIIFGQRIRCLFDVHGSAFPRSSMRSSWQWRSAISLCTL